MKGLLLHLNLGMILWFTSFFMSVFKWDHYFQVNIADANNWFKIREIFKYMFTNKRFIILDLCALPQQWRFQSKLHPIEIQINRILMWLNEETALKCSVVWELIFASINLQWFLFFIYTYMIFDFHLHYIYYIL